MNVTRIDKEHRIVYEVHSDKIIVLSLKGHY
ncbi:MAG: type II toxin-antitoxin system YoeB family toxin [Mariniphaga sp.]|nr:type II toxin-antitoxin system YoeB family toxin [Mariniphaga sp.]